VNVNLFKSGNSNDFLRLGDVLLPDGDVGFDDCGDICGGRDGMGKRRFGLRELGAGLGEVEVDVDAVFEGLPLG